MLKSTPKFLKTLFCPNCLFFDSKIIEVQIVKYVYANRMLIFFNDTSLSLAVSEKIVKAQRRVEQTKVWQKEFTYTAF